MCCEGDGIGGSEPTNSSKEKSVETWPVMDRLLKTGLVGGSTEMLTVVDAVRADCQ
jgi:hypothetical protein